MHPSSCIISSSSFLFFFTLTTCNCVTFVWTTAVDYISSDHKQAVTQPYLRLFNAGNPATDTDTHTDTVCTRTKELDRHKAQKVRRTTSRMNSTLPTCLKYFPRALFRYSTLKHKTWDLVESRTVAEKATNEAYEREKEVKWLSTSLLTSADPFGGFLLHRKPDSGRWQTEISHIPWLFPRDLPKYKSTKMF